MITRRLVAAVLLRCYPAEWRREYGGELGHILESHPPTARIVVDVALNGLRQRARSASPSTILGLVSMLLVLSQFAVASDGLGRYWPPAVRPSGFTFPTIRVTLLASELYVYVGIACGYWTELRWPGSASRASIAAMRMILIAGSPVIFAGLLIGAGLIDASVAAAAGRTFAPSPAAMILAPLAGTLPFWIWGGMGAWMRQLVCRRRASRQQKVT
jgi:hypothetical protein